MWADNLFGADMYAIFYDPWIGMEQLLISGEIEFAKMLLECLKENSSFQMLPKHYSSVPNNRVEHAPVIFKIFHSTRSY